MQNWTYSNLKGFFKFRSKFAKENKLRSLLIGWSFFSDVKDQQNIMFKELRTHSFHSIGIRHLTVPQLIPKPFQVSLVFLCIKVSKTNGKVFWIGKFYTECFRSHYTDWNTLCWSIRWAVTTMCVKLVKKQVIYN